MQPPFYNTIEMYRTKRKGGLKMYNWSAWIDKVHPIRALLALTSLAATVYMIIAGLAVPDAWWVIVTGLCLYYVEGIKSSTPAS